MKQNRAIVEELYQKFGSVIYDLCVRILKDASEAEDALQETFVHAYRSIDSVRNKDSYLSWLYRVATRVCLRLIRRRRRKGLSLVEDPELLAAGQGGHTAADLQARRTLEKLLEELDERGQEIIVAHFLAGIDQGEIAQSMGISRRAVVKRITAIRKRVATLIEEL